MKHNPHEKLTNIDSEKIVILPLINEMLEKKWQFPSIFSEKVPFRFVDILGSKNLPSPTILHALERFGESKNENGFYYVKEFLFYNNLLEPSKAGLDVWYIPFSFAKNKKYSIEMYSYINFVMVSQFANWILIGLEGDEICLFAGTEKCGDEIKKINPYFVKESAERFLNYVENMYENRRDYWRKWSPELFLHLFGKQKTDLLLSK